MAKKRFLNLRYTPPSFIRIRKYILKHLSRVPFVGISCWRFSDVDLIDNSVRVEALVRGYRGEIDLIDVDIHVALFVLLWLLFFLYLLVLLLLVLWLGLFKILLTMYRLLMPL